LFYAQAVCGAARRTIVERLPGLEVEIAFPAAMVTAALLAQALTPLRQITALADALTKLSGKTNAIRQRLSATRTFAFVHQPTDLLSIGR
jgi:hypothetical protein